MTHSLRFITLACLAALAGCASMDGLITALEPVVDFAAQTAANSAAAEAADAAAKHGLDPVEVGGAIAASLMALYGAGKAAAYAWNRDPNKKA